METNRSSVDSVIHNSCRPVSLAVFPAEPAERVTPTVPIPNRNPEASSREIKRVSSRVMRILGVILVFAVIVMGIVHWHQQRENTRNRQEYTWQQEVYPELNRLYETEDYKTLLEKVRAYEDEGHDLYQWEHRTFCELYESTIYADLFLESRKKGLFGEHDAVQLLHDELKFRGLDHRKELPSQDRQRLHGLLAQKI